MPPRYAQPHHDPHPEVPPARRSDLTDPLFLTAEAVLQSKAQGGPNAIALANPFGHSMEIHEIRWQLRGALTSGINGGAIGCQLNLGSIPLTNGFVPVFNFGRMDTVFAESQVAMGPLPTNANLEFQWRLPRPLFVPAGAVLTPKFEHRGEQVRTAITVRISYVGASLPASASPPKRVPVPWVAFWASNPIDITAPSTQQSRETDLVSPPGDADLILQRFSGRLVTTFGFGAGNVIADDSNSLISGARFTTIRMVDSRGNPIIRKATPFRQAFEEVTRTWELPPGSRLTPKGFYRVFMRHTVEPNPALAFNLTSQLFVGMVGYREIDRGDV